MRKPLERNKGLQLVDTDKIRNYADKVIDMFFDEFSDIDCHDLMYILMLSGNHKATIRNIQDNDTFVK